jgi:hypothetical protein
MGRRIELEDLMKEIGINNLTDLVIGCGHIAKMLNDLPPTERMRLQARLSETLTATDETIPFAGRFLIEVIHKGLDKREDSLSSSQ